MRPSLLLCVSLLVGLVGATRGAEPDPEVVSAEKTLRDLRIGTDGPSLVKFFQDRTLTDVQRGRLKELVRQLGHDDFTVRERATEELSRAGRVALPLVKGARKDVDVEIARRAGEIAESIEQAVEMPQVLAAARLLAERKADGAAEALVAYLPMTDQEIVLDAITQTLRVAGVQAGKGAPVLVKLLESGDPLQRALAGDILGRLPAHTVAVAALLQDSDARVRFRAAASLVRTGYKPAVDALIRLLVDAPVPQSFLAHDLLGCLAGDRAPVVSLGSDLEQRTRCRDAWVAWWKEARSGLDLTQVQFDGGLRGLTLLLDVDIGGDTKKGMVWEFGRDGTPRWELGGFDAPVDAFLLPGGRILVAEGHRQQVTERDREGKILWTHKLTGYATTCCRLPTGNTFVASYSEMQELDPAGRVVWEKKGPSYRVTRLKDGNYLYATGENLIELTSQGKEVRTVKIPDGTGIWTTAERLPGGNYLVAQYSANRVIELTPEGKVVWTFEVKTPSSAQRLPSGAILITAMDQKELLEVDRSGKVLTKMATRGRPFLARRY